MKAKVTATALFVLCLAALAVAGPQEKKEASVHDQDAMMAAWLKAATPGAAHKALEPFVGTWEAKATFWALPGADPVTSSGTAEAKWVLDGRFVEQRFSGSFQGMPFTGIGYTGYDNIKKQYVGMWMDSMGTGVMISTGKASGEKSFEFEAVYPDAMTGRDMLMKETVRIIDSDRHVFEMWSPAPDGKGMFKSMEIVYTRRKP
ncbi:MAG TPA: DUF1579 domain-containing protein [Thermoanaerobaculia bacterium]|nr:DUF1579 domain-containing protein [Thermoanaerobaculia bacterium]